MEAELVQEEDDQPAEHKYVTMEVTAEQESAMEAFFQINSWQLIKEFKGVDSGDGGTHQLTVQVTQEQEAAIEAFFQINNWTFIKHVDAFESIKEEQETVTMETQQIDKVDQLDSSFGPIVEEVAGLQEVQVTATGANGQPQIITVYTEGTNAHGLPQSLLEGEGRGEMPQVIIQEITLPDGMSLDQGLVITNPQPSVLRVTPRGTVKPGDKIHKCHVCGKTFKQAQSFNGHYQSHFGAKPYQCDICNTGFTLKAALVAHHSIHTGAKPFTCSLCNKGFRRKDDMVSHIRTHTGEKPYECDICGKKFKYRNQIPKHRRAHTGEKPYCCKICDKSFTSNIHLRRHERTHTGERPYKCQLCPKAFTQCGHLQAHMRIHTDERPFACSICGRGFREKKVMKKHETLHTTERKYKCGECGKGFLRQSNLELHAVMHQKGKDGAPRERPRPKKKRQPDAEMREFVANVLSTVKKVDSSMQTETVVQEVTNTDQFSGADNLHAFVDFAVEQSGEGTKMEPLSEIQTSEEQYTLVMQDDGTEGYLISNYGTANEEIVSMPSQQVEIASAYSSAQVIRDEGTVVYQGNQGIVNEAVEVTGNQMDEQSAAEQIVDSIVKAAVNADLENPGAEQLNGVQKLTNSIEVVVTDSAKSNVPVS